MNNASIVLALGVIASGLFSGLLVAVLALLQQSLKTMSALEFTVVMQRFLPLARKAPINYLLVLTPVLAPAAALVLGIGPVGSPRFLLTLAGMLVFMVSTMLISTFAVEPLYNVILSWNVHAPPLTWQAARDRYFSFNWLRLSGALCGFILLLAALVQPA